MPKPYSYNWFIQEFENTQDNAEQFITSIDETLFLQPPAKGKWSIAECYSHLVNYGDLYVDHIYEAISNYSGTLRPSTITFPPRWLPQKIITFFEPPYRIKLKTIKPMKPDEKSQYNRTALLNDYIHLQDQLIVQLKKAREQNVDLGHAKVNHPIFSLLTMTLSECFLLLNTHQHRHQWQAEQTLMALQSHHS